MSRNTKIPAVVSSLSTERALRQIKALLENYASSITIPRITPSEADRVNASLDDIDTMLDAIVHEPCAFVGVSYLIATGGSGYTRMWLSDLPKWLDDHPYHMVIRLEIQ